MKSQTLLGAALATLVTTTFLHAQESPFKPGLTIGTLVNLDVGGTAPKHLDMDHLPVQLSDAELSVLLKLRPNLTAQTVLVNDNGTSTVDQAFATWNASFLDLSCGKLALPLGLYNSHLITDPLLIADLETIAPAVLASKTSGALTCHLGLTSLDHEAVDEMDMPLSHSYPNLVAAVDAKWGEEGLARLSTRLAHHSRIYGLAAQIPAGPLTVDLEGTLGDGAWVGSEWTASAGLAWSATEALELATRYDSYKANGADKATTQAGVAATFKFADVAYTGAEWMQGLNEDGEGALTLRLGLEGEFAVP